MRNIICDKSGDIICEDMNTDVYRFNERIEDEFEAIHSFTFLSLPKIFSLVMKALEKTLP